MLTDSQPIFDFSDERKVPLAELLRLALEGLERVAARFLNRSVSCCQSGIKSLRKMYMNTHQVSLIVSD